MKTQVIAAIALGIFIGAPVYGAKQAEPRVPVDLPGNPLAEVEIGMGLKDFMQHHPNAKSGMFGKSVDSEKQDQTIFENTKFYGGSEVLACHFQRGILMGVDYSIFTDDAAQYRKLLKPIVRHYRGRRGKASRQYIVEEEGKKKFLAGRMQWEAGSLAVGVEFAPPEVTESGRRAAVISIRLAEISSNAGLTSYERKPREVDSSKSKELFGDAE